jgi:hypothetical protein
MIAYLPPGMYLASQTIEAAQRQRERSPADPEPGSSRSTRDGSRAPRGVWSPCAEHPGLH